MNRPCIIFLVFTLKLISETVRAQELIDLTYTYNNEDTPTHPFNTRFRMKVAMDGLRPEEETPILFYSNDFSMGEHTGTHIDAPRHIGKFLQTVDTISLDKLYKIPGVTIDVSTHTQSNINYAIEAKDIENWIEEHGDIPDGSIIIFRTGWDKKALDRESYLGYDANRKLNFPGIGASAAKWIVNYQNSSTNLAKGIIAVAVDSVSLDAANAKERPAHEIILQAGIYGIENTANTWKLPPKDFTITMLPMKINHGTGSPIRMIAEINGIAYKGVHSSAQKLTN